MKLHYKLSFWLAFMSLFNTFAQKVILSGKVTDSKSNESLIGVSVYIPELQTGAVTNEYGYYSLSLPTGTHNIVCSYIGYDTYKESIIVKEDLTKNINITENIESLNEVIIESNNQPQISIKKPEMSVNKLSINTIKKMPVVLGETDVIKSLLQLPGVTSAGEGASGFNVRGGSADQNLILLDEVNLFSSSHLFGLFSIFNPDAVKDLKLYKAGMPARYGGRISSALDIYQKDGNYNNYHASGGIGLLSSRLLVEGPISKGKTSFLAGGRSSYAHLFLPLFDINNKALFYDLNLKVNHIIDDNNKLFLSSYFGKDIFSLENTFANQYGNNFVNLRWNHLFSNKLFSNLSAIYSNYFYQLQLDFVGFLWNSSIDNYNIKYDLVHYLNDKTKLRYGTNQMYYDFNPGKIEPLEGQNFITNQLTKKSAIESAYYAEAETEISPKININTGLRLSTFFRMGQESINEFEDNLPVRFNDNLGIYEEGNITGTSSLSKSEILEDFVNLEPRFNIAYEFKPEQSLKASFQRTAQYIHLISNTNSPTPLDVWTPSGPFIKPQKSNQYALGWFSEYLEGTYSLSVETYFKTVENRINYIDGADIVANNNIETVLLNGENRAYGLEILLQKNIGKFRGWFAYTLSRSEDRVEGNTTNEPGLNNGEWFSSNVDKTHDLSANASYKLNNKWSFSAAFNYQTGIPSNFPIGQYTFQDLTIPVYGARNADRLPSYHRLDISATLTPKKNEKRKIDGEWVFGIYNLYNRMNASSISFARNQETGQNEATRLSLFGIIPSISYNFKF